MMEIGHELFETFNRVGKLCQQVQKRDTPNRVDISHRMAHFLDSYFATGRTELKKVSCESVADLNQLNFA